MGKNVIKTRHYESPCGILLLGSFGDKLCLCDWETEKHHNHAKLRLERTLNARLEEVSSAVIEKAINELDDYFAGKREVFDIPLLFTGTEFQKAVWNALLTIPFGKTVSYTDVSKRISKPKAVRAVANAIGANPISVIVPCHRVIGSNNSLTGYGGGLDTKRLLLESEGIL